MSWSGLQKGNLEKTVIYEVELDETDSNNCRYDTYTSVLFLFLSLILHVLDIIVDFVVAHDYYKSGKYVYFGWTIALFFIPAVIMTLISIRMYVVDMRENPRMKKYVLLRIFLSVFGMIIQAVLLIRFIDCFLYAVKALLAELHGNQHMERKYRKKRIYGASDVTLLRLFECYLESAPQLVLQITLLVIDVIDGSASGLIPRLVMITFSCLGIGLCMATYHDIIKQESTYFESSTKTISVLGIVIQFFWHLFFTASRIAALSAVVILYPLWTGIAILIHWLGMSIWLGLTTSTQFCGKNSRLLELCFASTVALIYIFNFLSLKEKSTKYLYIVFDSVCGIENLISAMVWGLQRNLEVPNWLYYVFLIVPILCFVLSVLMKIIYYEYLHPNRKICNVSNKESIYVNGNPS